MHNPLTQDVMRALFRLDRYAEIVERALAEHATALEETVSAASAAFAADERHEYFASHAEDFFELSTELPTLMRYSIVTAADAVLEAHLTNTCAAYAEVHKVGILATDLSGSGLHRGRDYLKKVAVISFPDTTPAWTAVTRLRELRNCIVHAEGQLRDDRAPLATWLASQPDIRLSSSGVVTIGPKFISAVLAHYTTFVEEVDIACEPLGLWASVFPPLAPSTSDGAHTG